MEECSSSQWPRGLERTSRAARLLRLWVRIPPGAWMSVWCECCVLSVGDLCDELITRPEESYRLWCVVLCDLETSWMRRPWPTGGGAVATKTNKLTKRQRVIIEEATFVQSGKMLSACPELFESIPHPLSCLFMECFNIIFPFTLWSPKWPHFPPASWTNSFMDCSTAHICWVWFPPPTYVNVTRWRLCPQTA